MLFAVMVTGCLGTPKSQAMNTVKLKEKEAMRV